MRHKALVALGCVLVAVGVGACGAFTSGAPAAPSLVDAWFLEKQGRTAEAMAILSAEIERWPLCAHNYLNNRGAFYTHHGEYELALSDYSTAARLDPWLLVWTEELPQAINLGQYEFGDGQQASTNAEAQGYFQRGSAYAVVGRWALAIEELGNAISLDPLFAAAYVNRGVVFYGANEPERAIRDFDKAVGLDPQYAKAYFNRGLALGQILGLGFGQRALRERRFLVPAEDLLKELAESEQKGTEDFSKAVRLNPEFAMAYDARSLAYSHLQLSLDSNTEEHERLTGLMEQDQERVQGLGGKPRMLQDCY